MTMLLYANIYNISYNVLRPTFFIIYNVPFLRSPNIGKIRVKFGPKTDYFSYITSSCTNRITGFNNFFYWYAANWETNKTVPAIFFFPNIFWIIYLQPFSCKIHFRHERVKHIFWSNNYHLSNFFWNLWRQTNRYSSKKVNVWASSGYFPFFISFFCWNHSHKKQIVWKHGPSS